MLLFVVVGLGVIAIVSMELAEERLNTETRDHLGRLVNAIDSTLSRHAYLPMLLAEQDVIKHALVARKKENPALNQYLEEANRISGTSDLYLMDRGGNTISASNWNTPYSFIGQNFAFRPYFQQAVNNALGRYYALGTTSGERGYYFAYPVVIDERIKGVMVAKIAITSLEQAWSQEAFDFMVTDEDGIVFLASKPAWRYKTLSPIERDRLVEILETRRYASNRIEKLDLVAEGSPDGKKLAIDGVSYLTGSIPMQSAGWNVMVLASTGSIMRTVILSLLAGLILLSLLGLLTHSVWQRQHERRRYELHLREELEDKVAERTGELKQAHESLIQAAKLAAIGQLSAGINHELNNPLTAIRSYAENARAFLSKGNTGLVENNLGEIGKLTERMAAITAQLKIFSRKSSGSVETFKIDAAIEGALAIMQPQLKRRGIVTRYDGANSEQVVIGDLVWTEQILVNLLSNAAEAIPANSEGHIGISCESCDETLCISVSDNGAGIDSDALDELFEPFFTTKSSGQGLGLGLSISYQLARNMRGTLEAENNIDAGAIFRLRLPLADS